MLVLLLHDALTDGQETEPSACQGGLTGDDSGGSFHLDSNYGHHTDDCTYLLSCPVSHTALRSALQRVGVALLRAPLSLQRRLRAEHSVSRI